MQIPKRYYGIIIISTVIIVFVAVAIAFEVNKRPAHPPIKNRITRVEKKFKPKVDVQTSDINKLIEGGLLDSIDPKNNEAFVETLAWNRITYQQKETIGLVLAFYCGKMKRNNLNWCVIRDKYSGKKLAKYSEAWGFSVY